MFLLAGSGPNPIQFSSVGAVMPMGYDAPCGGKEVTGAFLRYGNMCSPTTELLCGYARTAKWDRIGLSVSGLDHVTNG